MVIFKVGLCIGYFGKISLLYVWLENDLCISFLVVSLVCSHRYLQVALDCFSHLPPVFCCCCLIEGGSFVCQASVPPLKYTLNIDSLSAWPAHSQSSDSEFYLEEVWNYPLASLKHGRLVTFYTSALVGLIPRIFPTIQSFHKAIQINGGKLVCGNLTATG